MENIVEWIKFIGTCLSFISILLGFYVKIKKQIKAKQEAEIENLNGIKNEIASVKEDIKSLKDEQRINEKDRLKDHILEFEEKLKLHENNPDVYDINLTSFEVIYEDYAKYKALGGNHYVDIAKKYIDEMYQKELHK